MFDEFTNFVRDLYGSEGLIPLHEPTLAEKEKKYLIEVVNSSFVSSIGKSVTEFETQIIFLDKLFKKVVTNFA